MKLILRSDDEIIEGHHYISNQVINYLEGFHLAVTNEDVTALAATHVHVSFEVVEKVFNELDLASLKQDVRRFYHKLPFNIKEVQRIADEVRPTLESLRYNFRLRNHTLKPSTIDSLFDELFTLIKVREDDKPRFKASLSTIMTQCIRDITGIETNRLRFALVLYGSQGCGKTTFNSTLCKVMIGKDVHLQKKNLYNSFDSQELLNPVFRVEDLNYQFRDVIDVMKSYITNITETTVNMKYKPEQRVVIRTTALLDTNNDFINIVKTDGEQRRFCIFELLPSEQRIKRFEEQLEECLTKLFQCHTTEYLYDLDEITEANLELTNSSNDFMKFLEDTLYSDDQYFGREIDLSAKGIRFTKSELKKGIKELLGEFDQTDKPFLHDGLFLKAQMRFFRSDYDTRAKGIRYILKRKSLPAETADNAEKFENPLEGGERKTFPKNPQIPQFPQTGTLTGSQFERVKTDKPVVTLKNALPENMENYNIFDGYIYYYRENYISSVIIASNRILFYDRPEKVQVAETEEVEDTREFLDVSTLTPTDVPIIHWNSCNGDHTNTHFPHTVPLRKVEDFRGAIEYDTIGGEFEGEVAKNENFISANTLLVDVDAHKGEDLSNIDNVNQLKLEYFRVKSKSGNGYHFYFPLSHYIKDREHFKVVYLSLLEALEGVGVKADPSGKNPSRKFFGTRYTETAIHNTGSRFDVVKALETVYRIEDIKPKAVQGEKRQKQIEPRKVAHKNFQPEGENPNHKLTDQYIMEGVNHGEVVQDLPSIVNYLLKLKENSKQFYSNISGEFIKIDEALDLLRGMVEYDPSHVQFIDTLIEGYKG